MTTPVLSALFVFIWATGFIVAGIVASHADPLTFLTVRHVANIAVFVALSVAVRAAWPRERRVWRDAIVAGMLLHGVYLSGVFWAVSRGLPPGITALVTGLHPLLRERLVPRQWAGIFVGVLGVALIVGPKTGGAQGVPWVALAAVLAGTLGLTLGTLWQKRSRPQMDLRVNASIQYVGALVLTAPFAIAFEPGRFDASPALWGALAWAVLGLSAGGIAILLVLLKRGDASRVAPLLYLSPAVAALMSWALFGEAITGLQMVGMLLAVAGCFAARA